MNVNLFKSINECLQTIITTIKTTKYSFIFSYLSMYNNNTSLNTFMMSRSCTHSHHNNISMCGRAFFSLFFINLLPIPLFDKSSTLRLLLVLRQPTIPSTAFSLILFPCKSTCSICVSHSARTTCCTPSSVRRFLARDRVLRCMECCFRHLDRSPACMSLKSTKRVRYEGLTD
jgi:hypothetical protein